MTDPLDRELVVACALARAAGVAIEAVRERGFETQTKSDASPVTVADLESERVVRGGLAEAFPDDGLVSEETLGQKIGKSGRAWIIDPLDGTLGFVERDDWYAVHIGLLVDGQPTLGVVHEPHTGRLFRATPSSGCVLEAPGEAPRALTVDAPDRPRREAVIASTRLAVPRRLHLAEALGRQDAGSRHSVGCKVGALVCGEADVYVGSHPIKVWDSCAPLAVLRAFGGTMSGADGAAFRFDLGGDLRHPGRFVATTATGAAHDRVCQAVLEAMGW